MKFELKYKNCINENALENVIGVFGGPFSHLSITSQVLLLPEPIQTYRHSGPLKLT